MHTPSHELRVVLAFFDSHPRAGGSVCVWGGGGAVGCLQYKHGTNMYTEGLVGGTLRCARQRIVETALGLPTLVRAHPRLKAFFMLHETSTASLSLCQNLHEAYLCKRYRMPMSAHFVT